MSNKMVNDAFRALVAAIDAAATAETKDGRAKPGLWRSAKARLLGVYQISEPGNIPTEDELWEILGQEPPVPQDPSKPMKGAKVVVLYAIVTERPQTYRFAAAAVRKRPKVEEYEAVSGYEDFGHRRSNVSQGFVWETLHGVYGSASEAKDALADKYALRPHRR